MSVLDLVGPIFRWEVIRVGRRLRTFRLRAGYLLVLLALLFLAYADTNLRRSASPADGAMAAHHFFLSMSYLQLLAIVFITPFYVASPIPKEKEQRTFEYLFDTDISNRELALGKWAAGTLTVAHFLIAGVPVLALSTLLGGIEPSRLLLLTLITLMTLWSVSALCLFVSVFHSKVNASIGNAQGAVILLILVAPYLPRFFGDVLGRLAMNVQPFTAYSVLASPDEELSTLVGLTLGYCAFHGLAALVLLATSCVLVRTAYVRGAWAGWGARAPSWQRQTANAGRGQ